MNRLSRIIQTIVLILSISLVVALSSATWADNLPATDVRKLHFVLLINDEKAPFWQLTRQAADKAAQDLGIKLEVIPLGNNPLRPVRTLNTLLSTDYKPDAVLFSNLKHTGQHLLNLLEQHQIYSMVFDNGFSIDDQMGSPGDNYQFWKAQLLSGNELASRRITQELIEKGLSNPDFEKPLSMIALEGAPASDVSNERLSGLKKTLREYAGMVQLHHVFPTNWEPDNARDAVLSASRRYPGVNLIWSSNDDMAISAARAIAETGKMPGEDVYITGFDLTPEADKYIRSGRLLNSYGGHYMSAAWSIIYMYDFFQGFNQQPASMQLSMISHRHEWKIPFEEDMRSGQFDTIDFTQFSKAHRQHKKYPFLIIARRR